MRRSPVKGVASLIGSGTLEGMPQAVAAFLREHLADLDKAQFGEYLGHHEEFSVRGGVHVSFGGMIHLQASSPLLPLRGLDVSK